MDLETEARSSRTGLSRLVLWDVDGTLLSAGPAAQVAFATAVEAVVGRPAGEHGVHMSGKTDPEIALEILAKLALSDDEARGHLPGILRSLEAEVEGAVEAMLRDGRVHPGVPEALAALARRDEVLSTLLTGNLAANARVKVSIFGLDRWLDLDVGAYGSDSHARTELVPIALEKVRRRHGAVLDPGDVWVVGDTPRDLDAARAAGTRCMLVGTGRYPVGDLEGLGADVVLPNLGDTERVVEILTS